MSQLPPGPFSHILVITAEAVVIRNGEPAVDQPSDPSSTGSTED